MATLSSPHSSASDPFITRIQELWKLPVKFPPDSFLASENVFEDLAARAVTIGSENGYLDKALDYFAFFGSGEAKFSKPRQGPITLNSIPPPTFFAGYKLMALVEAFKFSDCNPISTFVATSSLVRRWKENNEMAELSEESLFVLNLGTIETGAFNGNIAVVASEPGCNEKLGISEDVNFSMPVLSHGPFASGEYEIQIAVILSAIYKRHEPSIYYASDRDVARSRCTCPSSRRCHGCQWSEMGRAGFVRESIRTSERLLLPAGAMGVDPIAKERPLPTLPICGSDLPKIWILKGIDQSHHALTIPTNDWSVFDYWGIVRGMTTEFKENLYPQERIYLFSLCLHETLVLLEDLRTVQRPIELAIRDHVAAKRMDSAASVLKRFLFESEERRGKVQNIIFFLELFGFLRRARAPSVDERICRYLFDVQY